jgi:hypothetical protein
MTKPLKGWVHNYLFLVLNTFRHFQTAFNAILSILSKYYSNKSFKSPTHPILEFLISLFKDFKSNKVHFTKINLKFQAREKIHFIESDDQNRTRNVILERMRERYTWK